MCCDDTKSCSHYCPFGPGCKKCEKLDTCVVPTADLSPTDTPGSDEASLAETIPDSPETDKWILDSPEPNNWIDYMKIPTKRVEILMLELWRLKHTCNRLRV